MKIKKRELFHALTKTLSAIDGKEEQEAYTLNITEGEEKKRGIAGGYVKETYRNYAILDKSNDKEVIILSDKDRTSSQDCYQTYKAEVIEYPERELEEIEVQNILLAKVMEYPELVKFYELLKTVVDYNKETYGLDIISFADINLIADKMKSFTKKYGHASDAVQIGRPIESQIKKVRTRD